MKKYMITINISAIGCKTVIVEATTEKLAIKYINENLDLVQLLCQDKHATADYSVMQVLTTEKQHESTI